MIALTGLLVFLTVLVLECVRRRYVHWRYFARRKIPGPRPHFLWGNYLQLRSNHRYWLERWTEEYGDTFGVFWGRLPLLVTGDPDLAQRVLVKEFSNFVDRAPMFALERIHPMNVGMLMHADGATWKKLRSVITPAFSSKHMRAITEVINEGVKEFGRSLSEQKNKQFDIYPLLRSLTMTSINRTAFGVDSSGPSDNAQKSPIILAGKAFFEETFKSPLDVLVNSFETFTSLFGVVIFYGFKIGLFRHSTDRLIVESRKIVNFRRKSEKRNDIMQTLLDANDVIQDDASFIASGSGEETTASSSMKKIRIQLSDDDVIANSVLMLLAGYETTSTALAATFHLLAKHPEVQEKLRQEIVDAISGTESPEVLYSKVMNLKYLDLCIKESLRLYPPVTGFTTRRAAEPINFKGLEIEAGQSILFPTHIIQNDRRNFENPLSFIPERFIEKPSHPLAYQPFGDGPRNCVGMRMALLTMKLVICHVLPKFKFSTNEELEIRCVALVSQPKEILLTAEEINPSVQ